MIRLWLVVAIVTLAVAACSLSTAGSRIETHTYRFRDGKTVHCVVSYYPSGDIDTFKCDQPGFSPK